MFLHSHTCQLNHKVSFYTTLSTNIPIYVQQQHNYIDLYAEWRIPKLDGSLGKIQFLMSNFHCFTAVPKFFPLDVFSQIAGNLEGDRKSMSTNLGLSGREQEGLRFILFLKSHWLQKQFHYWTKICHYRPGWV